MCRGRSGPVARNLIGPEQKCEALEDVAHCGRSQGADSITESRLIDGADLGDVYDAGTRKSRFAPPEADVARYGAKPEVRCDGRDDSRRYGASIEPGRRPAGAEPSAGPKWS